MKLIQRTTRYYLIYTFFIFACGAVMFSFLLRIVILDSIDHALLQEEIQMVQNLEYEKQVEDLQPTENVTIRKVNLDHPIPEKFATIGIYDENGNFIDYRQLKRVYQKNGHFYEITIRQSMSEAQSLITSIIPLEIGLFLLLMLGVIGMNRFILNQVWQPFYTLLEKVKNYDPQETKLIPYEPSSINEFNELSQSVENMTERIHRYFQNQKEFNENSSHELQTPVSIIRNKLELLIQSKSLKEEDMELIQAIFEAVDRLSQLNKGLLLLSKIENQQFSQHEPVNVTKVIKNLLSLFQDQWKEKHIIVSVNLNDDIIVETNPIMMDILFTNLLSNAIKHNRDRGILKIYNYGNKIMIMNTGLALSAAPDKMFDRFVKNSTSQNSVGLGLSIVKKICEEFNFQIKYLIEDEMHKMEITLPE